MDNLTVCLPWPSAKLNPNARVHWSRKAQVARRARQDAYSATRQSIAVTHTDVTLETPVSVSIVFCPPDRRRRDWDNLIASMKPSLDGIALALGIDDSHFRLAIDFGDAV